jgi:hypothetical protein
MAPRKCIYTGEEATSKSGVMPKEGDPAHNWANRAPVNSEYQKAKQGRLPTDLEMEANRLFYLMELAKLEVSYLEAKLKEVQYKITGKKQEEIEKAHHIKDLVEGFEEKVEEKLQADKRKFWDTD